MHYSALTQRMVVQEIAQDHFSNAYKCLFQSQQFGDALAECMMRHVEDGTFPVFAHEFDSLVPLASLDAPDVTHQDKINGIEVTATLPTLAMRCPALMLRMVLPGALCRSSSRGNVRCENK
eukprot:3917603-Rhodomonas_salina.2